MTPLDQLRLRLPTKPPWVDAMPLSPEQELICERLEDGVADPHAAALIRQQAQEIDDLWDQLSRAYALVRRESPSEMIQEEMEALRAILEERRSLSTRVNSQSSAQALLTTSPSAELAGREKLLQKGFDARG